MKTTNLWAIILVGLTWAASCKTIDPYIATGELEHTMTREVITTGAVMLQACNDHKLTAAQCDAWVAFVAKYKVGRLLYLEAWRYAVAHQDDIAKGKALDIIMGFSGELSEFTTLTLQLAGGGVL